MNFLSLLLEFCVQKYVLKALINTVFPLEHQTWALCIPGAPVAVFLEKKAKEGLQEQEGRQGLSCQSCTDHRTALECKLSASWCPDLAFSCSATCWLTAQHFGTQSDSQVLKMMVRSTGKICAQQYPQTGTSSSANRHGQKRSGTPSQRLGSCVQEELVVTSGSTQLLKKWVLNPCSHWIEAEHLVEHCLQKGSVSLAFLYQCDLQFFSLILSITEASRREEMLILQWVYFLIKYNWYPDICQSRSWNLDCKIQWDSKSYQILLYWGQRAPQI